MNETRRVESSTSAAQELDAAKRPPCSGAEGPHIPMKGILQTSSFAKAILNRETGLIPHSAPPSGEPVRHFSV